jgi:hypothetical protein
MQVRVTFHDEGLALEVPADALVGEWQAPAGIPPAELHRVVTEALESPRDFPPLRSAVVPGDHVVIALGSELPGASTLVAAIASTLTSAGVEPDAITVVAVPGASDGESIEVPPRATLEHHDTEDRARLAYLASTKAGRRIYLNRVLTDADFVIPVGRLAHDELYGGSGPWRVLFPGLSDTATLQYYRSRHAEPPHNRSNLAAASSESIEVSWLLGCQLQIGVVPGRAGAVEEVVAGSAAAVLDQGAQAIDRRFSLRAESRAELLIAGVSSSGGRAGWNQLARAIASATRLTQHGGKIVALSRARGATIGPAMKRLIEVDDPRRGASALKGHETDPDYPAALALARALAWADVYLLSELDRDTIEALSIIPLDRPEEAKRLASMAGSCLVVSDADLVRAGVEGEAD